MLLHQFYLDNPPADRPLVLSCAGGYRRSVVASLFERPGTPKGVELVGGMGAWTASGQPTKTSPPDADPI